METLKILFFLGMALGAITSGVQSMAIAQHTHDQAINSLKPHVEHCFQGYVNAGAPNEYEVEERCK